MRMLICGDTVPTAASAPLFAEADINGLFGSLTGLFRLNDRVIVNLECALTEHEGAIRKFGPNLKGPVETAATLAAAGVTDCCMANNHILDFGVKGMRDTARLLDECGLGRFGCGENARDAMKPYFIEQDGVRVALLAFNEHEYTYALEDQPGAAPFEPFEALFAVSEAKKQADRVIVLYHGGKEYCEYPSPRLRSACHAMAKMGADVVLCQHSHIIGCMEMVGESYVVYGQGNFHFVKYLDKPFWNRGLMAQLDIGEKIRLHMIPVEANGCGVDIPDEAAAAEMLEGFYARSAAFQDGTWLDGWREFAQANKDPYVACIKNAYAPGNDRGEQLVAHYLDCEAHLDMLREIYQTWHRDRTDGSMEV